MKRFTFIAALFALIFTISLVVASDVQAQGYGRHHGHRPSPSFHGGPHHGYHHGGYHGHHGHHHGRHSVHRPIHHGHHFRPIGPPLLPPPIHHHPPHFRPRPCHHGAVYVIERAPMVEVIY